MLGVEWMKIKGGSKDKWTNLKDRFLVLSEPMDGFDREGTGYR